MSSRKRKRSGHKGPAQKKKRDAVDDDFFSFDSDDELSTLDKRMKGNFNDDNDENIASDSDEDGNNVNDTNDDDDADDDEELELMNETADEKRIRMAKQYLAQLEQDVDEDEEDDDTLLDPIAHRLQRDVLRSRGKLFHIATDNILSSRRTALDEKDAFSSRGGHRLAVTSLAMPDHHDNIVYSASKDAKINVWDVETGKKSMFKASRQYYGDIYSLAVSTDNKYLVSAGVDKIIRVWDPRSQQVIEELKHHRDEITSVCFRKDSYQLFSGSKDRQVKIWSLESMAYLETLYGHQDHINDIDCLYRERCVTAGGDRTQRLWKIIDETQLLFKGGHSASVDCIRLLNEETYITGSQDGSIACWSLKKKRPVSMIKNAHGGRWISSVCTQPFTDLVASGSADGLIRFWRCPFADNSDRGKSGKSGKSGKKENRLEELPFKIAVSGFVNALKFNQNNTVLIAGVGQNHRLGGWEKEKAAKNGVRIMKLDELRCSDDDDNDDDDDDVDDDVDDDIDDDVDDDDDADDY